MCAVRFSSILCARERELCRHMLVPEFDSDPEHRADDLRGGRGQDVLSVLFHKWIILLMSFSVQLFQLFGPAVLLGLPLELSTGEQSWRKRVSELVLQAELSIYCSERVGLLQRHLPATICKHLNNLVHWWSFSLWPLLASFVR